VSGPFFPEVLCTYPPLAQVTWLYFRDHPNSPGSGALLSRERGGDAASYARSMDRLRRAGLLVMSAPPASGHHSGGRGRPVPLYRACTPEEARQALPASLTAPLSASLPHEAPSTQA